jgi:hypothetical protein
VSRVSKREAIPAKSSPTALPLLPAGERSLPAVRVSPSAAEKSPPSTRTFASESGLSQRGEEGERSLRGEGAVEKGAQWGRAVLGERAS